jgi:hypothetical protein
MADLWDLLYCRICKTNSHFGAFRVVYQINIVVTNLAEGAFHVTKPQLAT